MAEANDPVRAERDAEVLKDIIRGMSYIDIAQKHGIATGTITNIRKRHCDAVIKPAASDVVQIEIERLERLLHALDPKIEAGNVRAIEVAIKLSESLRRLIGVDSAIKLEVEHTANAAVTALEEKLRKAAQINVEGTE